MEASNFGDQHDPVRVPTHVKNNGSKVGNGLVIYFIVVSTAVLPMVYKERQTQAMWLLKSSMLTVSLF